MLVHTTDVWVSWCQKSERCDKFMYLPVGCNLAVLKYRSVLLCWKSNLVSNWHKRLRELLIIWNTLTGNTCAGFNELHVSRGHIWSFHVQVKNKTQCLDVHAHVVVQQFRQLYYWCFCFVEWWSYLSNSSPSLHSKSTSGFSKLSIASVMKTVEAWNVWIRETGVSKGDNGVVTSLRCYFLKLPIVQCWTMSM